MGTEDGGGDAWWKDAAKQNPRKTSIDSITANCMGILQLPYQRTYYNGVQLDEFIDQ